VNLIVSLRCLALSDNRGRCEKVLLREGIWYIDEVGESTVPKEFLIKNPTEKYLSTTPN